MRVILILLLGSTPAVGQAVFINEISAVNDSVLVDEYGGYDDWVELYNAGDEALDIGGYFLSDDLDNPSKWSIPTIRPDLTTIPAHGFLVLWLDGEPHEGVLHVGFQLSAEGEALGLFMGDSFIPVDTLSFPVQQVDISFGRQPDGGADWKYFESPTPNAPNLSPGLDGMAPMPELQTKGGFFSGSIQVELADPLEPETELRFTLDGRVPTAESPLLTTRINIATTTTLRLRAFQSGKLPSPISTQTYWINDTFSLPVVSVVTDPANLYDPETGILVDGLERPGCTARCENFWQDWERSAHVQYFEPDGTPGFSMGIGIKVFGNFGRLAQKKSLSLLARGRYGQNRIEQRGLFPSKPHLDSFDGMVLRAGTHERSQNEVFTNLNDFAGGHLDMQAYRPVVVFLNGAFHGVYSLMERKNAAFIENNYGTDDVDLVDGSEGVIDGDDSNYRQTTNFLSSPAFQADTNFTLSASRVDMESLLEHYVSNIFYGRVDYGNVRMWRPRSAEGRWRMIAFDFDWSDLDQNELQHMLDRGRASWMHGMLMYLMRNPTFKWRFINRMADLLNTVYRPDFHKSLIDSVAALVAPEMQREMERWEETRDLDDWERRIERRRNFAQLRPAIIRSHMQETLDLNEPVEITVNTDSQRGQVQVNTVVPASYPWPGLYFSEVPITLHAQARAGYVFRAWSDPSLPQVPIITLNPHDGLKVTALFEGAEGRDVVIHEINYNSPSFLDSGDWVELFNKGTEAINLKAWTFADSDSTHRFILPELMLGPGQYLVLCQDSTAFHTIFPDLPSCVGSFDFGLRNSGELVRWSDARGVLIDSLTYFDHDPWVSSPDGLGPTLELINASSDNSSPEQWQGSARMGGSPGESNTNPEAPPPITINEINYHPSDTLNAGEWVELFNPTRETVNLAGWSLGDGSRAPPFIVPDATLLEPRQHIVLCADSMAFHAAHGDAVSCIGDFEFNLSKGGDYLHLSDATRVIVDSLTYDDKDPWPSAADYAGATIELTNSELDNSIPENWFASLTWGGTPGQPNSVRTNETNHPITEQFLLLPNYPNPFRGQTYVSYKVPEAGFVEVHIYNALGQLVDQMQPGLQHTGLHTLLWQPDNLGDGLFFYQLRVDGIVRETRSAVLLK